MRKINILIGRGQNPDRRVAEVIRIDTEHDLALSEWRVIRFQNLLWGRGGMALEGTEVAVTGYPIGVCTWIVSCNS